MLIAVILLSIWAAVSLFLIVGLYVRDEQLIADMKSVHQSYNVNDSELISKFTELQMLIHQHIEMQPVVNDEIHSKIQCIFTELYIIQNEK